MTLTNHLCQLPLYRDVKVNPDYIAGQRDAAPRADLCCNSCLRFNVAAVERHLHEVEEYKWIRVTIVGFVAEGQTQVIGRTLSMSLCVTHMQGLNSVRVQTRRTTTDVVLPIQQPLRACLFPVWSGIYLSGRLHA